MVMRQTRLSSWRRPYQLLPGRDGAGPLASKGSTQASGASVNLAVRGRQSRATDQQQTSLKVAQWNAEGVRNKKPELQEFLRKHSIDIICIQETHLKEPQRFFVRGYELFRHDRHNRHKGGILTLVKTSIPAVEMYKSVEEGLEHQTVKIILPDGDLHITNCYSPSTTDLKLHKLKLNDSRHLVTGDFNSHSPSWGYEEMDNRGEEIEDWMMENGLILINKPNDKPTCYSRAWKSSSTPDLAMATEDIQRLSTRTVHTQLGGSDHLPVTIELSNTLRTESTYMAPSWNYKKANWPLFKEQSDLLCGEIALTDNLNENVRLFTNAVIQTAKISIPRGKRREYKAYWSSNLEKLHKSLGDAREAMEQNPTLENVRKHNSIRDAFNQEKTTEIRRSWNEKTSSLNMEKDSNKLWNLTKTLNEDTNSKHSRTVLEEEGEYHTGKMAANILADFYQEETSINMPRTRAQEVRHEIREQTRQQNPTDAMVSELTVSELSTALKNLKAKKAPGKDGITNEMIRNLGTTAKAKLLEIFNQSWSTGKFPDKWREAIIIPIQKKQKDKTKKSSYRPISLLSCLGKVMERIVNARLLKHLEANNMLSSSQSAYRKNRSTEDQLVYLTQEIENAFQEKRKTLAVFIDLTKAFDKVWKDGLLLKLLHKKVEGRMFNWIQNFLQYRTARVKLDGQTSHRVPLQQGVPQGGVISPTLFIIFINDITEKLPRHVSKAIHADDLALWTAADHLTTANYRMQEALDVVGKWATDWGVEINTTKTTTTCFSLSNTKETTNLSINGRQLLQEDNPTYLGIKLDKRLTWNQHLKEAEKRATRKLALMKKLAGTHWGANGNILQKVYVGTVRPTLEYGMSAWATASKTSTNRLVKVQNAGLRLITGGMKTTPIQQMEKHTGIHTLGERREQKVLTHSEKLRRMPTHPMQEKLQQLTQNRLKRKSFNHLSRHLLRQNEGLLSTSPAETELLCDYEDPDDNLGGVSVICDVPGIDKKGELSPSQQRMLTLEMIDHNYNPRDWTHVFTDGSADGAVRNGGGGIFIKHPDGTQTSKAIPTGKISSNYRAESTALLEAIKTLTASTMPSSRNIVFFTDCKSLLQKIQNPKNERQQKETRTALQELSKGKTVTLQWVPSHCGVVGNEKADALSKAGSQMEQFNHSVSYSEAKAIIHNHYSLLWKTRLGVESGHDPIHQLERHQQTILFRLRTGHSRLLGHMYRLKISHTNECPCKTGTQTPQHILQDCPTFSTQRCQIWPEGANMEQKLWGSRQDLERTAGFIKMTDLMI